MMSNRFQIEIVEAGYSIFDSLQKNFHIEGIQSWDVAWELQEMLTGEYDA